MALKDTIKLIPKVENRYGGLFLTDPVETNMFEIVYNIDIKNDKNTAQKYSEGEDVEGVVIWYLNHKPEDKDMRTSFGFKGDYNGLGIYVFKHERKWRILAIYN